MKKIIFCAIAALAISATGCGGCDKSACSNDGFDKFYTNADADSLVGALGYGMGIEEKAQRDQQMYRDTTFSVDDYLRGVKYALSADTTQSFMQGLQTGARMATQMMYMRQAGIHTDPNIFFGEYKRAMYTDAPSIEVQQAAYAAYQAQMEKYQRLKDSYDSLQIATSELSLANIEKGKAYVTDLTKEDPTIEVEESGLAIKIIEAGDGAKLTPDDKVGLNLVGKTIEGRRVRTYEPSTILAVKDFEEGVAAGLLKLGKGGKATIYVPGRMAYGIARQQPNIGPNELIVFDVEVVEVNPAATEN